MIKWQSGISGRTTCQIAELQMPLQIIDYNGLKQVEAGLPSQWYFDPAHHQIELKNLWHTNWLYVCREDALNSALSYQTYEIGDQNIVVLKTAEGEIRAFHNTCRHRGSVLCTKAQGKLKSKLITCPYHQWAYAADDGRLVKTTSFEEPARFDKADYSLFKVATKVWRGCIFISLNPDADWDTAGAFQRPPDTFKYFPMEEMVTGRTWRTTMACNWKTFWENFNECLHCPNVHPELTELVPLFSRRIVNPRDVPDWKDYEGSTDPKYRGGMAEGGETWSEDWSAQGHTIPSLTDEDLARGHTYCSSWPSVFIGGYPDHLRIVRMHPLGPEETELVVEWLWEPETLRSKNYDPEKVISFAKLVIEQDADASVLNQKGLHAAPFKHGVLMPEEYLLKVFHNWVKSGLKID